MTKQSQGRPSSAADRSGGVAASFVAGLGPSMIGAAAAWAFAGVSFALWLLAVATMAAAAASIIGRGATRRPCAEAGPGATPLETASDDDAAALFDGAGRLLWASPSFLSHPRRAELGAHGGINGEPSLHYVIGAPQDARLSPPKAMFLVDAPQAENSSSKEEERSTAEANARAEMLGRALATLLAALARGADLPDAPRALDATFGTAWRAAAERRLQDRASFAEAAFDMDASAAGVAEAMGSLASRSQSQAASLEQTAAAMEEMEASVKAAAVDAESADTLARRTAARAEEGRTVMSEAVAAMSRIEESSGRISDIVSVIDAIAFRTNLLALNAAVEAALTVYDPKHMSYNFNKATRLRDDILAASKDLPPASDTKS